MTERAALPRITKAYARGLIVKEKYIVDEEMCVVVYIARLKNNHRIVTKAIVANSNAFDPERGKAIAREKAIDEIIESEMYVLRSKLHENKMKEVGDVD